MNLNKPQTKIHQNAIKHRKFSVSLGGSIAFETSIIRFDKVAILGNTHLRPKNAKPSPNLTNPFTWTYSLLRGPIDFSQNPSDSQDHQEADRDELLFRYSKDLKK